MSPAIDHLREIERLLRAYDNPHQAGRVHALLEALEKDGVSAFQSATGGEWWGGSGSIADVLLHRIGLVANRGAFEEDNRKFRQCLTAVYEAMKHGGFTSKGAESWVSAWKAHAI